MGANKGAASKCIDLERRLIQCKAEIICPEAAEAFRECVNEQFSLRQKKWSTAACDQQVDAMQKCLKRYKLYPFQTA